MPRKKVVRKGGFVLPPVKVGADPVSKSVAAAVLNERLRGVRVGLPAADALMALGPRGCKWPIGDTREAGFHFCGADREYAGVYCEEHEVRSKSGQVLRRVRAA